MSVFDQNTLWMCKDESGNKYILYPITKLDCVDGAENLLRFDEAQKLTGEEKARVLANIGALCVPASGTVGQLLKITAVDESGMVTAVECVGIDTAPVKGSTNPIASGSIEELAALMDVRMTALINMLSAVSVTFCGTNGETLYFTYITAGEDCADPVADGTISAPTKENDAQYNYLSFAGWSLTNGGDADENALSAITENVVLYAAFEKELRYYTASFYDGETLMKTEQVAYGQQATPPDTEKDGYDFIGWSSDDFTITEDTAFYGTWAELPSEDILAEQSVSFALDSNFGAYRASIQGTHALKSGSTYVVEWDGAKYICTARNIRYNIDNQYITYITLSNAIGNAKIVTAYFGYAATTTEAASEEPFLINYANGFGLMTNDTSASHTVRIYEQE